MRMYPLEKAAYWQVVRANLRKHFSDMDEQTKYWIRKAFGFSAYRKEAVYVDFANQPIPIVDGCISEIYHYREDPKDVTLFIELEDGRGIYISAARLAEMNSHGFSRLKANKRYARYSAQGKVKTMKDMMPNESKKKAAF